MIGVTYYLREEWTKDNDLKQWLGRSSVQDMRCELIEYSGQRFNTGFPAIDDYFDDIDTTVTTTLQGLSNTDAQGYDSLADNFTFEQEGDNILDFSDQDPFTENITISDS